MISAACKTVKKMKGVPCDLTTQSRRQHPAVFLLDACVDKKQFVDIYSDHLFGLFFMGGVEMHTFVIIMVACIAFVGSYLLIFKTSFSLDGLILGAILFFGILTNLVFVPGLVLDEPAHISTAYRYANVWLGKPYTVEAPEGMELIWDTKGILSRQEDVDAMNLISFHGPSRSAYQKVRDRFQWFCSKEGSQMVASYEARAVECGWMGYLFPSIGIALARILHLGTYPMLYLGRLMNLFFFTFCIYWAVRITPVKKWLFALLALTPMCMQLVCSFSYDSPIIGMSFFATAWLLHLAYQKESITWKEWAFTGLLSFCLVPCKFTIYPFLLLLIVPSAKYGGKAKKAGLILMIGFCGLLGFLPQYTEMIAAYLSGAKTMAIDPQNLRAESLYSIGWIMANPKAVIQIFLHTIRQQFTFYWTNMLGGRLAVFEPVVDWSLLLLCTLLLSSMHDPADNIYLPARHRALCFGVFLSSVMGAMLMMLFMYTPFGSEVIEGVQGRYFLPALPMLSLGLGMSSIALTEKAKKWLTLNVFTINAATLIEVFMWIRTFP